MNNKEIIPNKRSKNFTNREKILLMEICQEYREVIENKKTDATTIKLKNNTWDVITQKFNGSYLSDEERNAKQLHALYDGIKKRVRKNLLDDSKELYALISNCYDSSDYLDKGELENASKDAGKNTKNVDPAAIVQATAPEEDRTLPENDVVSTLAESESDSVEGTSKKMKFVTNPRSSGKEELFLSSITNRFIERKNHKDEADAILNEKKIAILNMDEAIKEKELEKKTVEVEYLKLELEHLKAKQCIELQILETEKKIKEAQLKKLL